MSTFAPKVANGTPDRDDTLNIFRSYADVFGPKFQRALKSVERNPRPYTPKSAVPPRPPRVKDAPPRVVKDTRGLDRLRARLEDERTARRAVEDQLRAASRDRDLALAEFRKLAVKLADVIERAENESDRAARAEDRVSALEARAARLADDLNAARAVSSTAVLQAAETKLVERAEARADKAELRAARAERKMVEQAAALTGKARALTTAEVNDLRAKGGPAGPAVLKDAVVRLSRARSNTDKDAALLDVARAALVWRDRL